MLLPFNKKKKQIIELKKNIDRSNDKLDNSINKIYDVAKALRAMSKPTS